MPTSGVFQTPEDLLVHCDPYFGGCDWVGWVDVVEDTEDMTLTWKCGGCGHQEVEELGRDEND